MKRERTAPTQSRSYLDELGLKPSESVNLTHTSFRIQRDVEEYISKVSNEEGVSKAEIYRRLIHKGIKSYNRKSSLHLEEPVSEKQEET